MCNEHLRRDAAAASPLRDRTRLRDSRAADFLGGRCCRFVVRLAVAALVLMTTASCTGDGSGESLDGVRIELAVDPSGVDACRVERVARVDQNVTPLYMLRGTSTYSAPGHPERHIPIQVQFRGIEGEVTDRAVTLTDLPVECRQVTIDLVIEECISIERSPTVCPSIELRGQEAFASVRMLSGD